MTEPVVSMRGVSRAYRGKNVLEGIDLEVAPGEVVGVIGPNGGGKSTLLMIMAGLVRPSAGSAKVAGHDAHRVALESAGLVGLVLARPGLYPLLTGWENIIYFAGLFSMSESKARETAAPLLDQFELTAHMDQQTRTWSTGMQQKLSLIRALLQSPKLLLFDEPTANLDPVAARLLYDELRQRADDGLACVLVTHALDAAEWVCDRVLLLDRSVVAELETAPKREPKTNALLEAWGRTITP